MTMRTDSAEQAPRGSLEEGGIRDLLGYPLISTAIVTTRAFVRKQ